ncbi:MAG: hypothetical protein B6229_01365 [Spirochaetaceae bacterium 4572_7]|nr:MAG: hypothetical protein B6229_01365 [Spirochaetaceae bacterium 4572_7]
MDIVTAKLISFTEKILTYRDRSRYIKKEKAKNLHPFFEWLHAFLWAAGVVLLLNQYLFQAYVIPSPSMTPALKIQDRLLVNKLIYGPELIPSLFKLPGLTTPKRQDIILFENPEYHSRGAFFDISQRLIFMLSLSLIDIDKE